MKSHPIKFAWKIPDKELIKDVIRVAKKLRNDSTGGTYGVRHTCVNNYYKQATSTRFLF